MLKKDSNLNRECILFPTYAKRDSIDSSCWLINIKGWALSHNCSIVKQKMMMGITKSVAGKSFVDQDALDMFEQRFKYFLATNKSNKEFYIQSIGITTLEKQFQQFMFNMLSTKHNEPLISNDDLLYNMRPTNPISLLLDGISKNNAPHQKNSRGICLTTKSTGFFSGEFHLPHYKILDWAQDQNHCDARLIQIQSTSTESNNINYGVVNLIEPIGISIISDIDDTIKDTQILSGARKVLSKTFFEPPQDVTGMADIYMAWYSQGAAFHYVSNSPYQLLPMLEKFLRDSQFPPGSMHLRDDSKLISRLVETPGQAKREAIIQILQDFPLRKFVLIGDSGEIDLEIYTRIATEYPNQIMKIYIRDVTSPCPKYKKKHERRRRTSSTLSSLFNSTKIKKASFDSSLSESTRNDDSLTSQSISSSSEEEDINNQKKKKFKTPLGMRQAVTTTLAEYAVEPHFTGHRNTIHIKEKQQQDSGLIDLHTNKISTLEACQQLYARIEKARLQVPHIDITLFQDAQILDDDTQIRNALWDTWDLTTNTDSSEDDDTL